MTEDFEARLKEAFSDEKVTLGANGRLWVTLDRKELIPAVEMLRDKFSIRQLAVIVGEDLRDAFQCNYVFTGPRVIVLQVRIDHDNPSIPSLSQLVPGAMVYEREIKDLFGIMPVGHPDLRRQAVPEDWPEGVYPLRKDVQFARGEKVTVEEVK
ncbi:MAG: NADH-quinone oxidoreductase subunit C [Acidobacteria bacterium]|nr:NADH-quinone oxidoreductase subunit C [Acidobacteriota bacterium]